MLKILSVIGTRPEAIKMAPIIKELDKYPEKIRSFICVTAQHRELLDQVLQLFKITPDYDLDLMQHNQTLATVTSRILNGVNDVLEDCQPDWVLVQGDTTTVMATSLAAFYNNIKIGHVEAGLRTHHKRAPFPEEINRRITSVVADIHFAPTLTAQKKLLSENVLHKHIHVTGNSVIDALQWAVKQPLTIEDPISNLLKQFKDRKIILVTTHRRENFGQPLQNICTSIQTLSQLYPDEIQFVLPVHLNPNVHSIIHQRLNNIPNVTLLPPLNYLPLIHIMQNAYLILTDSGGIQEEAPSFGVPVLVLRDTTERQEAVEAGTVKLVGTNPQVIVQSISDLLKSPTSYNKMAQSVNPYGDGKTASRIVDILLRQI